MKKQYEYKIELFITASSEEKAWEKLTDGDYSGEDIVSVDVAEEEYEPA